ncbi:MAG: hypothetical protein LBT33_09765, partial [Spirochaetia bacterium]|nr:hypothetical protein [Spirochaetia bacterium]
RNPGDRIAARPCNPGMNHAIKSNSLPNEDTSELAPRFFIKNWGLALNQSAIEFGKERVPF